MASTLGARRNVVTHSAAQVAAPRHQVLLPTCAPRSTTRSKSRHLLTGIFDRKAKSIKTTPEIRNLFGITKNEVTPVELIRAMLKADVELLWFGGIGTYIKAIAESDRAHIGDGGSGAGGWRWLH